MAGRRVWDAVVVGAGPAGSAAALGILRERPAARVLLLDAAPAGRDKTCGDGVAAEVADEAAALGVDDLFAGCRPLRGLRVVAPGGTATAGVFTRPTWVVPRRILDARLLRGAQEAGADVRRERVRTLRVRRDGCVEVGPHLARTVVGADGAHSTVRRLLGIPRNPPWATALAVRGYAPQPSRRGGHPDPQDTVQPEQLVHMVRDGWPAYAWSFPLSAHDPGSDHRVNVGFGAYLDRLPRGDPRWLHRRLAELLPDCEPDPATLRAAHLPLSTWRPLQPDGPVLLAGDAASMVHPLTGEGIWYAVVTGRLAGDSVCASLQSGHDAGGLLRAAVRRRLGAHLAMTTVLGRAARRQPRLVDAAVAATADDAASFDALVRFGLAGGLPTPRLALRTALHAPGALARRGFPSS